MSQPLMAHLDGEPGDPVDAAAHAPGMMLKVRCGHRACPQLIAEASASTPWYGRRQSPATFGWLLMLPVGYVENPKGSGIWRRGHRIRRARISSLPSDGQTRVSRDAAGHLQMDGFGMPSGGPTPVVRGDQRPNRQLVGPIGVKTPPEIIIECATGHRSHVTVERIEMEVVRLRQVRGAHIR